MSEFAEPKVSFFRRAAMPVALIAMSGLIFGYALFSPADGVAAPEPMAKQLAPAARSDVAIEQEAVQRLGAMSAHRAARAGFRDVAVTDRATAIAMLHKKMGNSAAQAVKRNQVVAELESRFQAEPVDAAWSAKSEEHIVSAAAAPVMERAGFKPRNVAMDCRSRTCRISASFTSAIDAQDWSDRLLTQMGGTIAQARVAVLPQADGSYEVRVFGGRKG